VVVRLFALHCFGVNSPNPAEPKRVFSIFRQLKGLQLRASTRIQTQRRER
jgi:hypothetical protein